MWEMWASGFSRDARTLGSYVRGGAGVHHQIEDGFVRPPDRLRWLGRKGPKWGALEGRAKKVRPSIGKEEEQSGVEEGRWPPPGEDSAQSDTVSADAPFGTSLPGGFTRWPPPAAGGSGGSQEFSGALRRFPCFCAPPSWTGSAPPPRLPAGTGTAWREVHKVAPPARRSGPAGGRREHAA